ncbi:MAG: hypothetical protein JWP29_2343 [Rhodoferax sp.]|nr:hypothetical protein [Rhodoferax sp.]
MENVATLDVPVSNFLTGFVQKKGVEKMLRTIRRYLGMDVAFISNFRDDMRLFVTVDAQSTPPIQSGSSLPIDDGYCMKVVNGSLPRLIVDAAAHPVARELPATAAIPIGSHLSVPIRLESGEVYGTLCCFSYKPDFSLGERDLRILSAFAEVIAERLDENMSAARERNTQAAEIQNVMAGGAPRIVYQPIFEVRSGCIAGVECLSRFDAQPARSPDAWFRNAVQVGMGVDLEMHCIAKAIDALASLPQNAFIALNASPETIMSGRLLPVLEPLDLRRIVLEVTEHATVSDYDKLEDELAALRAGGIQLAVDDAGAGYASMRHILHLKPEVIKLDMSLTSGIDHDLGKRALARGLISFAKEIGTQITAEGVETQAELDLLTYLGVDKVQGYLLGRPVSLQEVFAGRPGGAFDAAMRP